MNPKSIGILNESLNGESRIALTPEGVKELISKGYEVSVESGAGNSALFSDSAFIESGASIIPNRQEIISDCRILLQISPPSLQSDLVHGLSSESLLVSFLFPMMNLDVVESLRASGATTFAMDQVPRITRAQSMDALSSMSTIAGYKAALCAADRLPRFFPMLMTAAGTISPAKVLVIGAGVAGLQAIATCKRLGATVEAFDVRPAVKEQIESLGAKFVGLSVISDEAEDAGGYAKETSQDTHAKELDLIASRLSVCDCVISTALIPGKRAPILITSEMISRMKPGSVIIDLAAPNGGNCEATIPGETIVQHQVTIVGRTDLIADMAQDASRMYSKNIVAFLSSLLKDGEFTIDLEDEITRSTLVTHGGKITHDALRVAVEQRGQS